MAIRVLVSQFNGPSFFITFNGSEHVDEVLDILERASRTAKYFFLIGPVPQEFEEKLRIVRRGCYNHYLSLLLDEMLEDLELDKKLSKSPTQQVSFN
jgi:hypothetical protein